MAYMGVVFGRPGGWRIMINGGVVTIAESFQGPLAQRLEQRTHNPARGNPQTPLERQNADFVRDASIGRFPECLELSPDGYKNGYIKRLRSAADSRPFALVSLGRNRWPSAPKTGRANNDQCLFHLAEFDPRPEPLLNARLARCGFALTARDPRGVHRDCRRAASSGEMGFITYCCFSIC